MRPIVVGTIVDGPGGLKMVNFWARIAIGTQARQDFFHQRQASSLTPAAPGDYSGVDAQEVLDFRDGKFREETLYDIVDPTLTAANVEARLVRLATAVGTSSLAADTSMLSFYGTYYDGAAWVPKSA